MAAFSLLAASALLASATASPPHNLLHAMTNDEREHYFGSASMRHVPEFEVVDFAAVEEEILSTNKRSEFNSEDSSFLRFPIRALGHSIDLRLAKTGDLLAPAAALIRHTSNNASSRVIQQIDRDGADCHYIHTSHDENEDGDGLVAAISICGDDQRHVRGLVLTDTHVWEVMPLTDDLRVKYLATQPPQKRGEFKAGKSSFSLVKRTALGPEANHQETLLNSFSGGKVKMEKRASTATRTIEVAVFFDMYAFRKFSPFFGGDSKKLRDFILCYMNGVQALYRVPSLGENIDLAIVRLEIFEKAQPAAIAGNDGNRQTLYDDFCAYQEKENIADDANPGHWDMALLVSALDFYDPATSGSSRFVTMGLAAVGAVCTTSYNCVIAELGTTDTSGKPYPSAGFVSAFALAHEIGHNLGMSHDKDTAAGSACDKNQYIMSPSRGVKGKTQWSECSRTVLKTGDLPCLNDKPSKIDPANALEDVMPGQQYGVDRQCEIYLLDADARMSYAPSDLAQVCSAVQCHSPKRDGDYMVGPALEGTTCGDNHWCNDGKCVARPTSAKASPAGAASWAAWTEGACASGCLAASKGYKERRRQCEHASRLTDGCVGPKLAYDFCDDSALCKIRLDASEYAAGKCKEFAKQSKLIDPNADGRQASHAEDRPRQACSIYCTRAGGQGWYTPVADFNDLPALRPFFPDGTFCHEDPASGEDYFCQQGSCLPESSRIAKATREPANYNLLTPGMLLPKEVTDYFSLDDKLTPLPGGSIVIGTPKPAEEEDNDFIIIP